MTIDDQNSNVTPLDVGGPITETYREAPGNIEAEQGLLGAILVNNRAFEKVGDFLSGKHFLDPVHGRIYEACRRLIERGQLANPITLKSLFDQDDSLKTVGGAQYLVTLAASLVTVINADDYGITIKDAFLRRELIELGEQVVNEAYSHTLELPAAQQIEIAEGKLFSLAETDNIEGGLQGFNTALIESIRMAEAAYRP